MWVLILFVHYKSQNLASTYFENLKYLQNLGYSSLTVHRKKNDLICDNIVTSLVLIKVAIMDEMY